jgi:uncharacterized protein YndB with AHSA1/START domain
MNSFISIDVLVHAPIDTAWLYWTSPEHIIHWNFASPDWHCPEASSDLTPGGRFSYRMASRDEQYAFDFSGQFTHVEPNSRISFTLDDGRQVHISFEQRGDDTHVLQEFEPENMNPQELQRDGWQAIMNNYKQYTEKS